MPRKSKKIHLTEELCGNIPIKDLVKPLRPPSTASGKIATFHYGEIFTIDFQVYLYENGKGHAIFKYQVHQGDINYAFDETFDLKGRLFGYKTKGWAWVYICKCGRRTRTLFIGWDHSCLCRYCLGVRSNDQQTKSWKDIKIAQNPSQLKRLIRVAYTPYKKARAIRIYIEFLRRMFKAIRSKNPKAYLKSIGR